MCKPYDSRFGFLDMISIDTIKKSESLFPAILSRNILNNFFMPGLHLYSAISHLIAGYFYWQTHGAPIYTIHVIHQHIRPC